MALKKVKFPTPEKVITPTPAELKEMEKLVRKYLPQKKYPPQPTTIAMKRKK